jgi:CRISPR-associated exonuclease Cas4
VIDILFTELILKYLKSQKKDRIIGKYYPSELPWCLRKIYYDYTIGKDKDLESKLVMVSGTLMHSFISDVLKYAKSEGINVQSEVEYEYEIPLEDVKVAGSLKKPAGGVFSIVISGRADNIILLKSSNSEDTYVVEVKSKSKLPDEPRVEHIMQLNFYLHFNPGAKGYLLYITRDGFNMRAFEVNYNEELFKKLVDRAIILHNHIINNTLPDAEYWHGECLKCPYRNICFSVKKSLNSQE